MEFTVKFLLHGYNGYFTKIWLPLQCEIKRSLSEAGAKPIVPFLRAENLNNLQPGLDDDLNYGTFLLLLCRRCIPNNQYASSSIINQIFVWWKLLGCAHTTVMVYVRMEAPQLIYEVHCSVWCFDGKNSVSSDRTIAGDSEQSQSQWWEQRFTQYLYRIILVTFDSRRNIDRNQL